MGKVVIEVPAGLVDVGECAGECAVRELREETGYVGEVREVGTVMFNGMFGCFFPFGFLGKMGGGGVLEGVSRCSSSLSHALVLPKKENPHPIPPPTDRLPLTEPHHYILTDPGFCNTNLNLVHVTVDLSLPENRHPKPELEDNEFIEVFSTPLRELYGACKRWEGEGLAIDARVGTLAEGIEVARRWGV